MDNMLYILAGLAIIIVIGVLVMRKNKAPKPPELAQSDNKNIDQKLDSKTTLEPTEPEQPIAEKNINSDTKFDNLTVAQRFMDQQRYDKAIETLKRGLIMKPHDDEMSLKLLNVFAITNQDEDFNKTYEAIQVNGSADTIEKSQQLKALLDEEKSQLLDSAPAKEDKPADFESIDYDIPVDKTDTSINTAVPVSDSINDAADTLETMARQPSPSSALDAQSPVTDGAFDLTLDDLEATDIDTNKPSSFDIDDMSTTEDNAAAISDNAADNIDDDFTLSFDTERDESLDGSQKIDDRDFEEINFEDALSTEDKDENDDFVFELDDLTEEVQAKPLIADSAPVADDLTVDNNADEFALFLDETAPSDEQAIEIEIDDTPSALYDDLTFNDDGLTTDSLDDARLDTESLDDGALLFDDNTPIDDSSDATVSPTTTTPVIIDDSPDDSLDADSFIPSTLSADDIEAQFATDFDFVKSLDNHQVTLDLASQYLNLGEYDSAKRLLNEVISEGNDEQQQQAQELLTRTA